MSPTVVVVGATGSVGRAVLTALSESDFPIGDVIAISSKDSLGKSVSYGDEGKLSCGFLHEYDFRDAHVAIFATSAAVSERYAGVASQSGCFVVDSSSFFRLDPDVPLVVPEVNLASLSLCKKRNIVAIPDSCTTQMLLALNPLHEIAKIKRIVVSTYQSVSGAGKRAMSELYDQTKSMFMSKKVKCSEFQKQISFNCIPSIGDFVNGGDTVEELNIVEETKKIIGDDIQITATCVRVPVFVSHAEVINVEFCNAISREEAYEALIGAPGVFVVDHMSKMEFVTHIDCVNDDSVYVSRIREDVTVPHGLNMWVVCDNIRKGAAFNLVQITKKILQDFL